MMSLGVSIPRRIIYSWDLLFELVSRDMKLRYKRSVLGIAWSLLNPIAQLLVLFFVFSRVIQIRVPNYFSFLFTGLLAWSWFQSSLLLATGAIVQNRELIKRPGFPTAILPTVTVTTHLVHFLISIPVLLIFLMLAGIEFKVVILALPIVIAIQFILTLSLAYFVSTFQVMFRDTEYLLGIFLQLLFFLVPIFYDPKAIPAPYNTIYNLNPLVHVIDAYRAILIRGEVPSAMLLLVLLLFSSCLLFIGYIIFKRASYQFAEEL
jgi:lipopolysaccharide transport system permease protein